MQRQLIAAAVAALGLFGALNAQSVQNGLSIRK